MAIKGYIKERSVKALDALTGGPLPKRYFIVNVGIRQLASVKEVSLLLQREDNLEFRLIPVRMHSEECNWKALRALLGPKNPIDTKHLQALDALQERLAETGGIILKERKVTATHKGSTSNVFEIVGVELFDAGDEHPGIVPFSAYTKVKTDQIKSLFPDPGGVEEEPLEEAGYTDSEIEDAIEGLSELSSRQMDKFPAAPKSLSEWAGKLDRDLLTGDGVSRGAGSVLYRHYQGGRGVDDVYEWWKLVDLYKVCGRYGEPAALALKEMIIATRCVNV